MLLAPGDDALGEGGTHARQSCEVDHIGAVDIDLLTGSEGTGQLGSSAGRFLQC